MSEKHAAMGSLAGFLLCSGVAAHFAHLSTSSYAAHQALGAYYTELPGLVDAMVEIYQGQEGLVGRFVARMDPIRGSGQSALVSYFEGVRDHLAKARKDLPESTQLQNAVDEIAALVDSTIYKLKHLS